MSTMESPDEKANFRLSPEELAQFHRDGYLGPFDLYDEADMLAKWRRARIQLLDRRRAIYQMQEAVSGNTNLANYDRHLDVPLLEQHVQRPEIVDRLASILGPDVLCWRSEFFPKYPGDEGTDWHQEDTFAFASGQAQLVWPGESNFGGTLTAWTAFTPATEETACLRFIPGAHRTMHYDEFRGMHYDPSLINNTVIGGELRGFFGYDFRKLQLDPNWVPNEKDAVSLVMKPGQFILFWSTLMHASHAHSGKTSDMRMGYSARYVPTSVQIYPGTEMLEEYGGRVSLENYRAVLVSGADRHGHNRVVVPGKPETSENVLAGQPASALP